MFMNAYPRKRLSVITTKDGKRLYPVCSWEKNQHKLYNAYTRVQNRISDLMDNTDTDMDSLNKAFEEEALLNRLIGIFDFGVHRQGIVFAEYKDGQLIKDYIAGYDARHQ